MHDGTQQIVELDERRQLPAIKLAVAESRADAAEARVRLYAQCLESAVQAAILHIVGLNTVFIGLQESHVAPFDGEMRRLYNHSAGLLNRIRAVYALERLDVPEIPFEPARKPCVHPDVCTCGQCRELADDK